MCACVVAVRTQRSGVAAFTRQAADEMRDKPVSHMVLSVHRHAGCNATRRTRKVVFFILNRHPIDERGN